MSLASKIINQRFIDTDVKTRCVETIETISFTLYKMHDGENVKHWRCGSITMSSGLSHLKWMLHMKTRKLPENDLGLPF
ncbi:hypothetical protein NVP1144O_59 [Vibrio phage 1.144.O._10N.286.45.B3]|nr:hypothetical protein NVP1144O_59 [Vibrio phage 1.144.O._10N.286.45.B3]